MLLEGVHRGIRETVGVRVARTADVLEGDLADIAREDARARDFGVQPFLDAIDRLRGLAGLDVRVLYLDSDAEVLRRLVAGGTNAAIARDLAYSPSTIRNDVSAIFRALGVSTRAEAAARAISLGLV